MIIKFSNAEIDVWKLRKGVVVAYQVLEHVQVGHIAALTSTHAGDLYITVEIGKQQFPFHPSELIWLEPQ